MARTKSQDSDLGFIFRPKSPAQKEAADLWNRCRILFFVGPAGTGKTSAAMGLALRDAMNAETGRSRLWLVRPNVACGERIGYLPGTLEEKLDGWQGNFHDCFDALTGDKWAKLQKMVEVEPISIGMLRGRSLRNGVLIVDEAQLTTFEQLECVVTRLGENSKIVICGDPTQSDLFAEDESPLVDVAQRLSRLDPVGYVNFPVSGMLRDPLIGDILKCLKR